MLQYDVLSCSTVFYGRWTSGRGRPPWSDSCCARGYRPMLQVLRQDMGDLGVQNAILPPTYNYEKTDEETSDGESGLPGFRSGDISLGIRTPSLGEFTHFYCSCGRLVVSVIMLVTLNPVAEKDPVLTGSDKGPGSAPHPANACAVKLTGRSCQSW